MKKLLIITLANLFPVALMAGNLEVKSDGSWISISGKVKSVSADSFVMDTGKNTVKVDVDKSYWYRENADRLPGDKVKVYGILDEDLFEKAPIEASSIYGEELGSYFYASPGDEDALDLNSPLYAPGLSTPVILADVEIRGKVTGIEGDDFVIDNGDRQVRVDTSLLSYDPLDAPGFQQVDVGDRVLVNGSIDKDFFGNRRLVADHIVTLNDQSMKGS